jgi:hypothetical protein
VADKVDAMKYPGLLFGGIYMSNKLKNPVTGDYSCPTSYVSINVGSNNDLRVCVTDDYLNGQSNAVLFGGFFSCATGNPLAASASQSETKPSNVEQSTQANAGQHDSNSSQPMSNMTPAQRADVQADWPASCPKGFSRHVATVEVDGCQVYYCAPTHNMYDVINPPIKRPPFIDAPDVDQPSNASFIPDPSAQPWNDVSPSVDIGNTDLANITLLLSKLGISATNITTLLSDLVNKTAASSSSNDKPSASP